jgi:putative ABC transport system permease protein
VIGAWRRTQHFATAYARNLYATRLLSAIAVAGLAIGLAGALMLALVVRDAVNFYAFVPDHERTYLEISVLNGPGMAPMFNDTSTNRAAELTKANVPDVEAVGRLSEWQVKLRRNGETTSVPLYWADPEIFDVLRLPTIAGDPKAALNHPDGLVMTRSETIRHFGRANALGAVIEVDGVPMVLRAVIADLPERMTDLDGSIFASGRSAKSYFRTSNDAGGFFINARTYVRLRQGASPIAAERRLKPFIDGLLPVFMRGQYGTHFVPIDALALHSGLHPGARQKLEVGSVVAALILFIAVANYVNLSTALSGRRWREIGVRAACGATRGGIARQFLAEAVATVLIAVLLGAALVELTLPELNTLFQTQATFDYLTHPILLLWLVAGGVLLGLAAGAYPAFVLSGLSPAALLRDRGIRVKGRSRMADLLVTAQFAILIGLMIALAVVYQQRRFAMTQALRLDVDQLLVVDGRCPTSFRQEVGKLPGVRGVSCVTRGLLEYPNFSFIRIGNQRFATDMIAMLPSGFSLLGISPVAGSLSALPPDGEEVTRRVIVNETAVHDYGMGSASAAIGKLIPISEDPDDLQKRFPNAKAPDNRAQIVAVVPDFSLLSVERMIRPTIYLDQPFSSGGPGLVLIKLAGRDIPETLVAIDRLWRKTGQDGPIHRKFVSDHIQELYADLERGTWMFELFSGVAALLSATGIAGMAIATAERRTKEIGIRKALGARTGQVLVLLLARMSRPVLWANLIAWPCAWWLMRNWLNGFAYRVPLHLWLFPAAALIALAITLCSAGLQAWKVARRRPIEALRYE